MKPNKRPASAAVPSSSVIDAAMILGNVSQSRDHKVTIEVSLNPDTILALAMLANRRKTTFGEALEHMLYQEPLGGEIGQFILDEMGGQNAKRETAGGKQEGDAQ